MLSLVSRAARAVRSFNDDERGNESLQTVAILFIGALVMIALNALWTQMIGPGINQVVSDIMDFKFADAITGGAASTP